MEHNGFQLVVPYPGHNVSRAFDEIISVRIVRFRQQALQVADGEVDHPHPYWTGRLRLQDRGRSPAIAMPTPDAAGFIVIDRLP
jgi:hypothetical protein